MLMDLLTSCPPVTLSALLYTVVIHSSPFHLLWKLFFIYQPEHLSLSDFPLSLYVWAEITIRVDESDCLSMASSHNQETERFLSTGPTGRRVSFNEAALFDHGKKPQEKGRRSDSQRSHTHTYIWKGIFTFRSALDTCTNWLLFSQIKECKQFTMSNFYAGAALRITAESIIYAGGHKESFFFCLFVLCCPIFLLKPCTLFYGA